MKNYDIKPYVEKSLKYYTDFRNIAGKDIYEEDIKEWMDNSLVLIENGGSHFFLTKNKDFNTLTKQYSIRYKQVKEENIYKNLKVKCNVINPLFDYKLLEMSKNDKDYYSVDEFHPSNKGYVIWGNLFNDY